MKTRKKGRVRRKQLTIDEAAERLADIVERHLSNLSESERKVRLKGFHKTVSRICERPAKSGGRPQIAASQAPARGRA